MYILRRNNRLQGKHQDQADGKSNIRLEDQMTNGPVNGHLILTALLVEELMTPALGRSPYGPQEHNGRIYIKDY